MGNTFCKYLGGFLEVSLVSYKVRITGLCCWISLYVREGCVEGGYYRGYTGSGYRGVGGVMD